MGKGYWITFYHYVANPAVLTEYVKLATPVVQAHRGRFLSRGMPVKTYEAGLPERSVVVFLQLCPHGVELQSDGLT